MKRFKKKKSINQIEWLMYNSSNINNNNNNNYNNNKKLKIIKIKIIKKQIKI
jgi:hypothetical protein